MTDTTEELTPAPPDEITLPAGVVELGDATARTQGGRGGGSEDKRYSYE